MLVILCARIRGGGGKWQLHTHTEHVHARYDRKDVTHRIGGKTATQNYYLQFTTHIYNEQEKILSINMNE